MLACSESVVHTSDFCTARAALKAREPDEKYAGHFTVAGIQEGYGLVDDLQTELNNTR